MIKHEQIVELIKKPETIHVECKEAHEGLPESLWETYSAFANTDGGVILLGVRERGRKFSIQGVGDSAALIEEFWDAVNNEEKVSANILDYSNVYSVDCGGKEVLVIEVPRADRADRPVFIGTDTFKGAYRRNGEGDYRIKRESVLAMLRDQCIETADTCVLEELEVSDLNAETIASYRSRFRQLKESHAWNKLSDEQFLAKIGAAKKVKGVIHPTIAGLVCFGDFNTITDVLPGYFVDYRERLASDTRWSDRVCAHDATWSGNIYDFFFKIYYRITSDLKIPFRLDADNITAVEETEIHRSVRELAANALIHADYHGRQGVVIERHFRNITYSNPGSFLLSKEDAISGGNSEPRNSKIFNIFALVNIGERSGSGLSNLFAHWQENGYPEPKIEERFDPDRVTVSVVTEPVESAQTPYKPGQTAPEVPRKCPDRSRNGPKTVPALVQTPYKLRTNPVQTELPLPDGLQDQISSVQRVYRALRGDGTMTVRGLASKLGLNKDTITVAIGTLVAQKVIRRSGNKRTGHWEVLK